MVEGIIADHVTRKTGHGGEAVGVFLLSGFSGILKRRAVGHLQHVRHVAGGGGIQNQSPDAVIHNVHDFRHEISRV